MPKRFSLRSTNNPPPDSKHAPNPPPSQIPTTFQDSLPLPTIIVFDLDYTLWPFWVDTHVASPVRPVSSGPTNTVMRDRHGEEFSFYPDVPSILHSARQRGIVMSLASRTHAPDLARDMLRGLYVTPATRIFPSVDNHESHGSGDRSNNDAVKADKADKDGKDGKGSNTQEKPIRAIEYFTHSQIYPGTKTTHFREILKSYLKSPPPFSPSPKQISSTTKQNHLQYQDMLFFDDESRNKNVETELGVTFWLVRDGVTRDEVDKGVWEWRKRRGITVRDLDGKRKESAEGNNKENGLVELEA